MKIGIFTFYCAANYGAVLQTYCLQEVLKDMGHDVFVIDYRPKYLVESYKTFAYSSDIYNSFLEKCKGFVRACLVAPIRWKRHRNFSKFIHARLNLYHLDLNDESNDFDAFVFGSDQIWNPKITCGFDKVYLGDFPAAKGKKLIAYAASAGSVSNFAGEDVNYFLSRLRCFDKVLVREKSLADYLNQSALFTSEVVLDPVLLAGRNVLERLLSKQKTISHSSYLLLFQIGRNDEIVEYATKVANEKKLQMIDVVTVRESLNNKLIKQTLSVECLLEYFKDASYIITSSFHGTVLSILFSKQFNTVSVNANTDERALFLLENLQIPEHLVFVDKPYLAKKIDYGSVNVNYEELKKKSLDILNELCL